MSVIAKLSRKESAKAAGEPALSVMDKQVRPKLLTPGRVMGLGVIVLTLAAGGYGYLKYGISSALSVPRDRVTVALVSNGVFHDYVPVTGAIAPEATVFLDTVEGGQVVDTYAEEGAMVEAGQILARLKNTRLELDVLGHEAQATEQQNYLANARLSFEQSETRNARDLMDVRREIDRTQDRLKREKPLEAQGISTAEIRNLEADLTLLYAKKDAIEKSQSAEREVGAKNLKGLEQSVDRLTQSTQLVRQALDNLTVTAPISGQLTEFTAKVGQVIGPGQRIGQIDTTTAYKLAAFVDEYYLGRIVLGQSATVDVDGRSQPMRVSKIFPNVRDRQFEVDLKFVGATPNGLKPGQTLHPRIELGETPSSLSVANGPFYDETGGLWALVVSSDGRSASKRAVRLGRRNPDAIEVLSGLSVGERVVTSSYQAYHDAERIDFQ